MYMCYIDYVQAWLYFQSSENGNITKNCNMTGISWRKITENCNIKLIDGSSWMEKVLKKINGIMYYVIRDSKKLFSTPEKNFDFKIYCKTFLFCFEFIDIC